MQLFKSTFHISKMDCSAEEQMVRLKLGDDQSIRQLNFDLPNRTLIVLHEEPLSILQEKIGSLDLGDRLVNSTTTSESLAIDSTNEARLLWYVLLINAFCFLLEIITGIIAKSMGLVADSLDMMADAFVYSLSLYAVGKAMTRKKQVAKVSGYLQLLLAVIGFAEVVRRFFGFETVPDFSIMIVISVIALIGNAACLFILQKAKSQEAHIKASMIFTSNDVIINIGVIAAAFLVMFTNSNKPDLVIGAIVFVIVSRGAFRILKLSK